MHETPFAASICSMPEVAQKPEMEYSPDTQLNEDWEVFAGKTPTWRKDTEDADS